MPSIGYEHSTHDHRYFLRLTGRIYDDGGMSDLLIESDIVADCVDS